MKRILLLISAVSLGARARRRRASARVVELGAGSTRPAASKCPADPCQALLPGDRATRAASGEPQEPVHRSGATAISWRSRWRSPKLTAEQTAFFNAEPRRRAGGAALGAARGRQAQDAAQPSAARQSPGLQVDATTSARVRRSSSTSRIRVDKGNIVALTVPTWLPALASTSAAATGGVRRGRKGDCGGDARALAASPPGGAARGHPLRLHLQAGAPALHGHVRPGPPSDGHETKSRAAQLGA